MEYILIGLLCVLLYLEGLLTGIALAEENKDRETKTTEAEEELSTK